MVGGGSGINKKSNIRFVLAVLLLCRLLKNGFKNSTLFTSVCIVMKSVRRVSLIMESLISHKKEHMSKESQASLSFAVFFKFSELTN